MSEPASTVRPRRRRSVPGLLLGAAVALLPLASGAAERWFPPDSSRPFAGWRAQLGELVDARPGVPASALCVVGWDNGDPASLQAYVVWPGAGELITWHPASDDPHSLLHETAVLDLRRDVRASEAEIGGSTFLVTRAWVDRIRSQCRRHGTTVRLPARAGAHIGTRASGGRG